MNTKPDDELLALWVEDELHGADYHAVEAWAASQPEWQAHRETARNLKPLMARALSSAEDIPAADFFQARLLRQLQQTAESPAPSVASASVSKPRHAGFRWLPYAAAACLTAVGFWGGTMISKPPMIVMSTPEDHSGIPILYTPERGVQAAFFDSKPADAGVILLDGVQAIPDSFEIPETASTDNESMKATADLAW
jgi:hypothetical protein